MVWLLAFDRLTVKARSEERRVGKECVPSGLTTSSMERAGWVSSFWMVPVPTALAIVVLVAPDRVTVKVSSGSNAVSAHTSTVTGLLVSPGAKVSVLLLWLMYAGLVLLLLTRLAFPSAVTLPVA